MMTQEQRERLARLVLGAVWSPGRVAEWERASAQGDGCGGVLSSGEQIMVAIWRWARIGSPPYDVRLADLERLDDRRRYRVVWALRLLLSRYDAESVDLEIETVEAEDAARWAA